MEASCHQLWEGVILEAGLHSVPVKYSDDSSCKIVSPTKSFFIFPWSFQHNGEDLAYLFSLPVLVPAGFLRNTQIGLWDPSSGSSRGWSLHRTLYYSDLVLGALSCWDLSFCLGQRRNEILCSLPDHGDLLMVCRSCCSLTPALTTSGEGVGD